MKNKHNKQRLIGGLIAAAGIIPGVIGYLVEITPLMLAGLPIIAIGVIWYMIATSNSRKVCDECGGSMAGCEYEYQEVRREQPSSTSNTLKVVVWIRAICPHCGCEKAFYKNFMVSPDSNNLQFQVDSFCRSHFE